MFHTYQLIRGDQSETYASFADRIFTHIQEIKNTPNLQHIKVTLTENAPPTLAVIPFRKSKIAAIAIVWNHQPAENPSSGLRGIAGSFFVDEALPVAYQQTWETGERTPGICLLTLFRRKKDISYDVFIDRWHNGHTPLSLEIHPLWHYSRNVVINKWGEQDTWYDGIVEEHCKTAGEMLNPLRFFKSPLSMVPNMIRVYRDVRSFLDYSSIEPYYTSEYIIR